MSQGDQEKVGYKKPPKHSQFKPGQSGNRKGRPRKRPAGAVMLDITALLNEPIPVKVNGQTVKMLPKEVELNKLLTACAKGDVKATLALADQLLKYDAIAASDARRTIVDLPGTMPWPMAVNILLTSGMPPWSDEEVSAGRTRYFAQRSDAQKAEDDAIGYPDL